MQFRQYSRKSIGLFVAAVVLGAVAGYLYYHFVGCRTGTCYITSNPWRSSLYGAVLGGLLAWPSGAKTEEKQVNDPQ